MTRLTVLHDDKPDPEQMQAIATARMIYYAAQEASELGLGECSQLLHFAADQIRMKFKIQDEEALLDHDDRIVYLRSK